MVDEYGIFQDTAKIEELLSTLTSFGVKVTAFAVGEIFERYPDVIKILEKYNCEIESHSFSHNFNHPDSDDEIVKSMRAFFNYFGKYPIGYRAPRGKISDSGIASLEKHGYLYDSSVFPSYFPDPFKYLFKNKEVHYYNDSNIMEIPFTSLSPARFALSISYIKLLGLNFYKRLSIPDTVCFGSHLHDFIIQEESFDKLPLIWKLIYSRNKYSGADLCTKFLKHVKHKNYTFCYMSEIYSANKKDTAPA